MYLGKTVNKIQKKINATFNQFNKLNFISKLFIIFLIVLFSRVILNNFSTNREYFENDDFSEKFEKKIDMNVYDKFYVNNYDKIYLNSYKNNYEIGVIEKQTTNEDKSAVKIIDIGCGTGYNVNKLNEKGYNVVGLDQSQDMINYANNQYSNCEFVNDNILNTNSFQYNDFDIITCLGKTIYEIKNKDKFFENCYSLLNNDGKMVINVVNRDTFKPYVQNTKDNEVLFNPEDFNEKITNMIIKFKNNMEFKSNYNNLYDKNDKNDKNDYELSDENIIPYSVYNDEFVNFDKNKVKKYELNMYMPTEKTIENIAESKGFKVVSKHPMDEINYKDEFLYVFQK
tara:strand:+ start:554 stop:1576 length:1023 start_codon:yes stop_codon:yes gene_type:complete